MLPSTPPQRLKSVAVILAGAVAKGAFEAGALRVIAGRGIPVRRIVAASSGALNGAAYAAGVRDRREVAAAEELLVLWREHSGWREVFSVNWADFFGGSGISDQGALLRLLRNNVRPRTCADPALIDLNIVVAPIDGSDGAIGDEVATTYERVLAFTGEHFDSKEMLEQVFEAAVATAAFPGVFAPAVVQANGVGRCFDGGVVNNNPIDSALGDPEEEEAIDAVIVIAPTPSRVTEPHGPLRGRDLIGHLVNMLINERLYRDLRKAEAINTSLAKLAELARKKGWSADDVEDIKAELGWKGRRYLEVIQIRPKEPLVGDAFSGLFSAADSAQYVEAGIKRAGEVLDQVGLR